MTREEAWNLLTEYNQEEFHLEHAQIVENVMRYFARELGYAQEEEFWGIVGLLHDLDFEQFPRSTVPNLGNYGRTKDRSRNYPCHRKPWIWNNRRYKA